MSTKRAAAAPLGSAATLRAGPAGSPPSALGRKAARVMDDPDLDPDLDPDHHRTRTRKETPGCNVWPTAGF